MKDNILEKISAQIGEPNTHQGFSPAETCQFLSSMNQKYKTPIKKQEISQEEILVGSQCKEDKNWGSK